MSAAGRFAAGEGRGDLARALRSLALGRTVADVWRETGYASERSLVEEIGRLAERVAAGPGRGHSPRQAPAAVQSARRGSRKDSALSVIAYSDGASSGNPGDAGCGVVIMSPSGDVLLEDYKYIGRTTNNVAEYEGAVLALARARELGATEVELKVDSDLVANQIRGVYRVKSANLTNLHRDLSELGKGFERFEVTRVGRAENKRADRLANLAIASHKKRIARGSESPE